MLVTGKIGYRENMEEDGTLTHWPDTECGRGRAPDMNPKKMKNGKCTKNLGRSAEWVYQLEDCRCRVKKLCQSGRLSAQGKQAATDWEIVGTEKSLLRQTGSLSTRNKLVLAVLNWKIAGTEKRGVQGKSGGS